METQKAIFAAGCFWGVEEKFKKVEGVISTRVGYTGGHFKKPTYRDVCSHRTGHAEAIEITFDPSKVSYDKLLQVFWSIHDPTTLNRQGPDVGTQYRSAIFYINSEQKEKAEFSKSKLEESKRFKAPIVTQIVPASDFWKAEEYHQQYIEKRSKLSTLHM
ncbi:MAG: peptide-methionine (S)-S-oxide reductase MsrA [Promethearchaeota archaeon]|jgi:methionine-S-sulfoxide reductase